MPKCPICKAELENRTEDGWLCECGEKIPLQYSDDSRPSCGCNCGHNH